MARGISTPADVHVPKVLGGGIGLRGGCGLRGGGATGFGGATGTGTAGLADSGVVFLSRLILAISSGAKSSLPRFITARTFLKSTMTLISASGSPNSAAASLNVFIARGISRLSPTWTSNRKSGGQLKRRPAAGSAEAHHEVRVYQTPRVVQLFRVAARILRRR